MSELVHRLPPKIMAQFNADFKRALDRMTDTGNPAYRHPTIQALFDRMFAETAASEEVWTGDEWRAAITEIAEEVPALKTVLADADETWTNDQWFEAVKQVGETIGTEDGE